MIDIGTNDIPLSYRNEINRYKQLFEQSPPDELLSCSKFYCLENDNKNNPIKVLLNNKNSILLFTFSLKKIIKFFLFLSKFFFISLKNLFFKNKLNKITISKNVLIFHREDQKIFKEKKFLTHIKFTPHSVEIGNLNILDFLKFRDYFLFISVIWKFYTGIPNISNQRAKLIFNFYSRVYELNASLIHIIILSRIINVKKIKRLFFTFEDLSRDKLLLHLIDKNILTYGIIHSPLIHLYRYNIYTSIRNNYFSPSYLISKYHDKLEYLIKVKNYSSKKIKIRNILIKYDNFKKLDNLVLCHPNDNVISNELKSLSNFLSIKFPKLRCINIFHPKINKNSHYNKDFSKVNSIILSSFMTNKGFEFYNLGYKVIYFGSHVSDFYNPVKFYNINFIQNKEELKNYISKLYV